MSVSKKRQIDYCVSKSDVYATGKRKTAIARVWLRPGQGRIIVNREYDLNGYFHSQQLFLDRALFSLSVANMIGSVDMFVTLKGGGISAQAQAISHGVAKALVILYPNLRQVLRGNLCLRRDPRVVERKKYGKHKARKSTQYSKR